jgi:hypothetical protein
MAAGYPSDVEQVAERAESLPEDCGQGRDACAASRDSTNRSRACRRIEEEDERRACGLTESRRFARSSGRSSCDASISPADWQLGCVPDGAWLPPRGRRRPVTGHAEEHLDPGILVRELNSVRPVQR